MQCRLGICDMNSCVFFISPVAAEYRILLALHVTHMNMNINKEKVNGMP